MFVIERYVAFQIRQQRGEGWNINKHTHRERYRVERETRESKQRGTGAGTGSDRESRTAAQVATAAAAAEAVPVAAAGQPHGPSIRFVSRFLFSFLMVFSQERGEKTAGTNKDQPNSPDERTLVLPFVTHRDSPMRLLLSR